MMEPHSLTVTGLVLDMVGVAVTWKYGWPQPNLEPGVSAGLENGTIVDGETVAERNQKINLKRDQYKRNSRGGLILLLAGFLLQFVAQFV